VLGTDANMWRLIDTARSAMRSRADEAVLGTPAIIRPRKTLRKRRLAPWVSKERASRKTIRAYL